MRRDRRTGPGFLNGQVPNRLSRVRGQMINPLRRALRWRCSAGVEQVISGVHVGDLIIDLLGDLFGELVWEWLMKPVLMALLVRPFRWLVVRPVRRLLARRRFRRDLEASRAAGQEQWQRDMSLAEH